VPIFALPKSQNNEARSYWLVRPYHRQVLGKVKMTEFANEFAAAYANPNPQPAAKTAASAYQRRKG